MTIRSFVGNIYFSFKKVYWFFVRPNTSGVKCVLQKKDSILMIRRNFGTDKWVFPGGAIKKGETPEEAVRREIKEDLGLELGEIYSLGSFTQTVHFRQETLHCFATNWEIDVSNFDDTKIKEVRWFKKTQLPFLTPVSQSVIFLFTKKF